MQRKDRMDLFGVTSMVLFSALLGFNQVVIKVVNGGFQPVFSAGLRSAGAILCVGLWIWFRRIPLRVRRRMILPGLALGLFFAVEFLLLFLAIDVSGVARISVIFYSMPIWLTLAAHFLLPGDRMTGRKVAGLALAICGVAWAMADRDAGGVEPNLFADLAALAASILWAGIALVARATPISEEAPEIQLFWQVTVSAVVLLVAAPFFGPLIRDLQPIHLWGMAFLTVVVVSAGFIFWFWLLKVYPASGVASFSFLSPVFGVLFGWLVLGEEIGLTIIGALVLVAAGIVLINRPARPQPGS